MIDERELLEAAAARYTLEPGIVERIYGRRDRQRRQQRITAFVIGLAIAIAVLGVAIRIVEGGQRPKPMGPHINAENVAYLTQSWSAPLAGGWRETPHVSVADGNVYVVDPGAQQLLVFAEECGDPTCAPMWTAQVDGHVSAGPVVDDGMVFLVSGQDVVAFETGCGSGGARCTPVWRGPVVGDTRPGVSLAVAGGIVWVGSQSDPPAPVSAYRADCGTGGARCTPWWSSDRLSAPLVADGRLYVEDGDRVEAFPTDCEPLTEGCDPVWAWQPPGSGATIVAVNTGVVLAQGNGEVYAIPTDCGSSCTPRWHAPGELLGVSEADGLIYVASWQGDHGELEAYCLDCTTPVFRAPVPPQKAGWPPGSLRRGSLGWGGVVGAGGAVIPGEDVVGLVPSDCGETCEITIANTGGLGFVGQLGDVTVTGGVAFIANPHTGGVLLAYDLSCSDPCPPAWIWEAASQGHAIQPPVFDRTSMFLVDAAEDASTLRAFRVGTTPQPGLPSSWGPDAGVVEHPDEGGIVAMSDAQQIYGTYDLDLDTGWMGAGNGSDLSLRALDDTAQALVYPDAAAWIHGGLAYLGQVDFRSITARDFPSFTWSHDPILRTGQLVPGAVFAVRTTEGNLSKVQVLRDDGYDLWLRWVTYDPDHVGSASGEPSGGSVDPLLIAFLVASLVIVAAAWALVVRPRRKRISGARTPGWLAAGSDHRVGR